MSGYDFMRELFQNFLWSTFIYGTGVWALLAIVFKFWKETWGDPQNWVKVLLSIVFPYVVVLAVYGVGCFLGFYTYSQMQLIDIVGSVTMGVVGSKVAFGITRGVETRRNPAAANPPASVPGLEPSNPVTGKVYVSHTASVVVVD